MNSLKDTFHGEGSKKKENNNHQKNDKTSMNERENIDMEKTKLDDKPHSDLTLNKRTPAVTKDRDCFYADNKNVESVVEALKSNTDTVKIEAARSLSRLLSNTREAMVAECGGVPTLIQSMLDRNNDVLRDECTKCLSKITQASIELRDKVISKGGLHAVLQNMLRAEEQSIETLLGALSSFLIWDVRPPLDTLTAVIPQLVAMLSQTDNTKIAVQLCQFLCYLSDGGIHFAQSLLDAGANNQLRLLLTKSDEKIVAAALQALRHLTLMKNTSQRYVSCGREQSIKSGCDHDWRVPLWTRLKTIGHDLSEIDLIICQNTELFKANHDDVSENENNFAETGLGYEGQVGLRCVHCGSMPFARAHFSIVFPGSIGSFAASLRHMGESHFCNCQCTPPVVRDKMRHILANKREDDNKESTLRIFCLGLCRSLSLQNRYPPRSGLILQQREASKNMNSHGNSESNLDYTSTQNVNNSNRVPRKISGVKRTRQCSSDTRVSLFQDNITERVNNSNSGNIHRGFIQDSYGIWRCRYCSPTSFSHGSVWEGPEPPDKVFVEEHLSSCPMASENGTRCIRGGKQVSQAIDCTDEQAWQQTYLRNIRVNEQTMQSNHQASHELPPVGHELLYDKVQKEIDSFDETIALESDKNIITPFTFVTLNQYKLGSFSLEEVKQRGTTRYQHQIGFGGLECIHCQGRKIKRKFFWTSVQSMSNSWHEVSKHLLKCKSCPSGVKQKIIELRESHPEQLKSFPKGSLTSFFSTLWDRIHHDQIQPITLHRNISRSESIFETRILKSSNNPILASPISLTRQTHEQVNANKMTPKILISSGKKKSISFDLERNDDSLDLDEVVVRTNSGRIQVKNHEMTLAMKNDFGNLPESDCFVRENLELFCASEDDVKRRRSRYPHVNVLVGQVGIRCLHCSKSKAIMQEESTYYPSAVDRIYECARAFHKGHLKVCPHASSDERDKAIIYDNQSVSLTHSQQQQWINSAKEKGLYDEPCGGIYKKGRPPFDERNDHDHQATNSNSIIPYPATQQILMPGLSTPSCISSQQNSCPVPGLENVPNVTPMDGDDCAIHARHDPIDMEWDGSSPQRREV